MLAYVKELLLRAKNAVSDKVYAHLQEKKDRANGIMTKRSPHWPAARRAWLKTHPACAASGTTKKVQVHHKQPVHLYPERELDQTNFITLSELAVSNFHLNVGHLGDWKDYNVNVESDAAKCLTFIKPAKKP